MNKKVFSFILFSILYLTVIGGDTLRVMHYNLLYYDQYNDFCTASNNNVNDKDGYLSQIVGYYKPDIFTVNELNETVTSAERVLTNSLNVNGNSHYRRANFMGNTYTSSGSIISMLYYNSNKLALKSQTYITSSPRNVMVYRLYYKPNLTDTPNDTIFMTCFVLHPKAGSTSSDRDQRTATATLIMNHIVSNNIEGNVMLMGDLNIYYSTEGSFVKYTTPTSTGFRFYDPANAVGYWSNNSSFAQVHTQSTSTSGGCKAGGGMDDRFDFVLTSLPLLEDNNRLRFVNGSYWALGQDGNRFNGSLISPSNNSLPSSIIMSLFNMSDHLPVTLKLYVNTNTSDYIDFKRPYFNVSFNNPVSDFLGLNIYDESEHALSVEIFDMLGTPVYLEKFERSNYNVLLNIPVHNLRKGLYLVRVSKGTKETVVRKFIKN